MDPRISTGSRPDMITIESTQRPTAAPVRVTFGQVLAAGANGLVQGAELAASRLPGSPFAAPAIRGPASAAGLSTAGLALNATPEGPGGQTSAGVSALSAVSAASAGTTPSATDPSGSIDASLQQSAQLNLYYLQIQQQVDSQNRSFTALSNVLKTEHDSAKAAIQNIHS
jgi:hypothetical protein